MNAPARSVLVLLLSVHTALAQQPRGSNLSQNLFNSVPAGAPTGNRISLSIGEAIDRALKYNLGPIISEQETRVSRAERLRALAAFLNWVQTRKLERLNKICKSRTHTGGVESAP